MKRSVLILIVTIVAMAWLIGPAAANPSTAGLFTAMDKNEDGKLTAKEYVEACEQTREKCMDEFQWFDRNGDGGVTMPEYEGKLK